MTVHEVRKVPRVFLDTCVLRHAIYERQRVRMVPQTVRWVSADVTADVAEGLIENPQDAEEPNLKKEMRRLKFVAQRAREKRLVLLSSFEQWWEYMGLAKEKGTVGEASFFDDLPIERIEFPYSRVVAGGAQRPKDLTLDFLRNLRDKRYNELADGIPGARIEGKKQLNHLLDAFHLRLAEHGRADFLLTTDIKFVKKVEQSKISTSVQVLSPTELREHLVGPTLWTRLRRIYTRLHST